jgi:hypothetical protein
VISRNYDNSQYDGFILDWLRRRTESGTSNYLYSLIFPLWLISFCVFTILGFCVIYCLRLIHCLRLLRYLFTSYTSNSFFAKTHFFFPLKPYYFFFYLAFYLYLNLMGYNKVLQSLIRCCLCYSVNRVV